jgi:hypothetical protein
MRPLLARKDTRADEDRQRRLVRARDHGVCQFEKLVGRKWVPCGAKSGTDTCHVYRRRECAKAVWSEDVALNGCRDCHTKYDQGQGGVRVPAHVEERAWRAIVAASKVLPPRQNLEGFRI